MSNTHEHWYSNIVSLPNGRRGPRERLPIPETDYHRLNEYQAYCGGSLQPGSLLLSYVIRHKLMRLKPVKKLDSEEMVTIGRQFRYAIDQGSDQDGLLVHQARWGHGTGVIPAYSILGVTLIGMQAGQRAPLLCENGSVRTITVSHVIQAI